MSKDKTIEPIEQREIRFYEDTVMAVVADDGTVYVPIRPMCELIGVAGNAQLRRIQRDPVLSETCTTVTVVQGGQRRQMIAVPLSHLNGWLFGISANRVKEEIRDAVIRYQKDCYNILYEAFTTGVAVRHDDELLQSDSPQGSAYRVALAVAKLAREQYYMGVQVEDNTRRIGLIEAQLSNPNAYINQEQAQQVSEAVKAIATVLSKRSNKNEFGGTYGELYRRYGITSYKHLPAGRFDHCLNWLREWWKELTDGSDLPF